MNVAPPPADEALPTRWQALVFWTKSRLLRVKRSMIDPHGRPRALEVGHAAEGRVIAESRNLLYPSAAQAEFALQAGKVQNLRVAARYLNGRILRAGALFSFWAHVPRPTAGRGFADGRELRAGCVIPSIGGGLCQMSNALYDAALQAEFEIVERHAHSRSLPDASVTPGRDATLFWNYVDLRFRSPADCQLEVVLTRSELCVRFRALGEWPAVVAVRALGGRSDERPAESCETCGVTGCFRNQAATGLTKSGCTAWLVDGWTPELDAYLVAQREAEDVLLTPLDRRRWKLGPYRWKSEGFSSVRSAPGFVAWRSWRSRQLQNEGAARQAGLLEMDARLAEIYARRIPVTALHVVLSQNLLPHLWRMGVLGGRTFDVLMTRLPLKQLQEQLDRAAERWPGTATLGDFRAAPELVAAEAEALGQARRWVTPHREIARVGGPRSILLDWQQPAPRKVARGGRVVFAASTLSRKGARELREALDGLDMPLTVAGGLVEGADFWGRREVRAGGDWLAEAGVVVLPAWVEHEPRRLLMALAAGVPVVCTAACGIAPQAGVTIVPEGDVEALRTAISRRIVTA